VKYQRPVSPAARSVCSIRPGNRGHAGTRDRQHGSGDDRPSSRPSDTGAGARVRVRSARDRHTAVRRWAPETIVATIRACRGGSGTTVVYTGQGIALAQLVNAGKIRPIAVRRFRSCFAARTWKNEATL
jgi:hypothetical protein